MTTSHRIGDWMQTYSGRQFWPLDPRPEEIHIEDIAASLAHQCRYAGHTRGFYSVAEHCVHISLAVPPKAALWGLLHDAAEAYLVDVPRPVKAALGEVYADAETRLMNCVIARFRVPVDTSIWGAVKDADVRILQMERKALMAPPPVRWATDAAGPPLEGVYIQGWDSYQAKAIFLERFEALIGEGR